MALETYRTVIICDANGDGDVEYYEADIIQPVSENLSTEITTHPLVDGNTLADHMIVQPMSLTLTGSFSLNGYKATEYEGGSERLANIQTLFENVMRNGTFCSIVTLYKATGHEYDEGKVRFVQRNNMILNNISWTKHLNSLDFTFGFVECLTATITLLEYETDKRDPNLPALTEASTLDFTENYLDYGQVDGMLIKMGKDTGIISDKFLEVLLTAENVMKYSYLTIAIVSAIALGLVVKAAIAGTLAASAAVFPVGTVIAVVGAVALAMAAIFHAISKNRKRKNYKIKQFRAFDNDEKNRKEVERFNTFVGQIHLQLEKLEDVMKVYGIGSNEAQECLLYIDNNYYSFNFSKNNSSQRWGLQVIDIEEHPVAEQQQLTGLSSIADCTESNYLFRTQGVGSYVYVMCPKQQELANNGATQAEIDAATQDLRNYQILVSQINMKNYTQTLEDIITNALEA